MGKKPLDLNRFTMSNHKGFGGKGHNTVLPRVTVIDGGKELAVYPDDAIAETMRAEAWTVVKTGFERNSNGEVEYLVIVKAEDGIGVNVRYYENARVNIHVSVKHLGKATAKPNAGALTVTRETTTDGADAYLYRIVDQVSIEAPPA
jgi:hypothetical protein